MAKMYKKGEPKIVARSTGSGGQWVARESASGRFIVVDPAKKSKRFTKAQLQDAVRKATKSEA